MAHVITQACCGDASCVFACPVNAIHPNPLDPEFSSAEMLYIDPRTCVDCGACVSACPVGAITPQQTVRRSASAFIPLNEAYHSSSQVRPVQAMVPPIVKLKAPTKLRVAIVGAGPAGLYAADALLRQPCVDVTVYDRLPTPYGLVRSGVAPDHELTKSVTRLFHEIEDRPGFAYALGVDVGTDLSHEYLSLSYSAVIYATGASRDRRLGISGEDLTGSATTTEFVAWYNAHPDHVDNYYPLDTERVVIIGNGNVALDVARILATDAQLLERTDISYPALNALRNSQAKEIVIVGRRGPEHAAFTLPELLGLVQREDIDIVISSEVPPATDAHDFETARKLELLAKLPPSTSPRDARPRIELRFWHAPVEIVGTTRVESVSLVETEPGVSGEAVATGRVTSIETGLVLRSIGYRGKAIPDVPFDDDAGIVPNRAGRVIGIDRTYVVGWIKRGPTGFIGTNKLCSLETVNSLLTDANDGLLSSSESPRWPASHRLRGQTIDLNGWRRIDAAEVAAGAAVGRPRVKLDPFGALAIAERDTGSATRRVTSRRLFRDL